MSHCRSQTLDTSLTYQEHQHRHAEHSSLASKDGAHDQRGTEGRPWQNATATCCLRSPFHQKMTFQLCLESKCVVNTQFHANIQWYTFAALSKPSISENMPYVCITIHTIFSSKIALLEGIRQWDGRGCRARASAPLEATRWDLYNPCSRDPAVDCRARGTYAKR
jgi:hypothetical protein